MSMARLIINHRKLISISSGVVLLIVIALAATYFFWLPDQPVLANYYKLFHKNTILVYSSKYSGIADVIGIENYCADEFKSYFSRKENAQNTNISVMNDNKINNNNLLNNNLIIFGTPENNSIYVKLLEIAGLKRLDSTYPGHHNGSIELIKNPWNGIYYTLLITAGDFCGLRAATLKLMGQESNLFTPQAISNWEQTTSVKFPIISKENAKAYAHTFFKTKRFIEGAASSKMELVELIESLRDPRKTESEPNNLLWIYIITEKYPRLESYGTYLIFDMDGNLRHDREIIDEFEGILPFN
jgi:hypothetical protein